MAVTFPSCLGVIENLCLLGGSTLVENSSDHNQFMSRELITRYQYLSNSEVLGNLGAKILLVQPGKYMGG